MRDENILQHFVGFRGQQEVTLEAQEVFYLNFCLRLFKPIAARDSTTKVYFEFRSECADKNSFRLAGAQLHLTISYPRR